MRLEGQAGAKGCVTAGTRAPACGLTPNRGFVMPARAFSISVGQPPTKGSLRRRLEVKGSVQKRGQSCAAEGAGASSAGLLT